MAPTTPAPNVLLVERDARCARSIARFLGSRGLRSTCVASPRAGARVSCMQLAGAIVAVHPSDRHAFALVERLLAHPPAPVVLVLGAAHFTETAKLAFRLGVPFIPKPVELRDLSELVRRIEARQVRLASAVRDLPGSAKLSARDLEVAAATLGVSSRLEIARATGVSLNTVKTHLRRISEKTGLERWQDIAALLYRSLLRS